MALVAFEGFEGGGTSPEISGASANIASGNNLARTGNGYHEADSQLVCTLPAPDAGRVTVGAACQFSSGANAALIIFGFRDSGGVSHVTLNAPRDINLPLELRRGTQTGTLIDTIPFTPQVGPWYYIEMQVLVHDTLGYVRIRVDGTQIYAYNGDTRNAGAANVASVLGMNSVTGGSWKQDDWYTLNSVDDTATTGRPDNDFLGPVRVQPLWPNGNGLASQWVGSDGDSADNFLLVDESGNPNTTDYVQSSVVGSRDLYELTDPIPNIQAPLAVRAHLFASKSDTGPAFIRPVFNDGGTEAADPPFAPAFGYAHYYGAMRKTRPAGGPWTIAALTALQAGVEVTAP